MIDEGLETLAKRAANEHNALTLLELGLDLWPGLHLVVGEVGAGKSQLALNAAVAAARRGVETVVHTPLASVAETTARLLGVVHGVSWSRIFTGATEVPDAAPLAALPLALRAAPSDEALIVTDRCPRSIDRDRVQTVIATVDCAVRADAPGLMDLAPDRVLAHVDLDRELLSAADTVLVLATMPPLAADAWRGARLAIAHRRAGVPQWVDLRFDGTRFDREAEEVELEFVR